MLRKKGALAILLRESNDIPKSPALAGTSLLCCGEVLVSEHNKGKPSVNPSREAKNYVETFDWGCQWTCS